MLNDKLIKRDHLHYFFDRYNEPALYVDPGEIIRVEAERADSMYLDIDRPCFSNRKQVMNTRPNPVTGPIYIKGSEPGDRLLVTVIDVLPCPDNSLGYITYVPGQGALMDPFSLAEGPQPSTLWCTIIDNMLTMGFGGKTLTIPVEPIIGTIGVAPADERTATYWNGQNFLGNVDCPSAKAGNTIVLPVNVEGAMLSLGDIHAKQGHGELAGCAVECRGDAIIRVDVVKGSESGYCEWPQINNDDFIGSIGCVMNSLERSVQAATFDLVKRLELFYGFRAIDAYMLLGQCAEIEICQATNPFFSCLAKIKRKYI